MNQKSIWNVAVIVSALGYFVDIFDLLLFSIVRVGSLRDIGVPEEQLLSVGVTILNAQMAGMLIGGVVWGIWGDRRGRLSVLFGSIFLYSAANIANAYVHSVEAYAILRFIAGLGLAGELGAAITLVCEVMHKKTRGYGTAVVASVGILGAIAAAMIAEIFAWRTAYLIGGGMGLALLVLRIRMLESGMYDSMKKIKCQRGDIRLLFRNRETALKYLWCILIGMPLWYVVGILITFSPELSKELGVVGGPAVAGRAVLFSYLGLSVGDLFSGALSQYIGSRKKVLGAFLVSTLLGVFVYCGLPGLSINAFYVLCFFLGVCTGFWAIFVTVASEQFGTNLRATVTTTAPNFVRGAVLPITFAFEYLQGSFSKVQSALVVGVVIILISLFAMTRLEETHGKDLDYVEK